MKFPTATPLFPPVVLAPHERVRYEQLAKGLVADTLADYDRYRDLEQRQVSKTLWKPVKARENVTVYKDRHHDSDDNLHRGLASGISISSASSSSQSSASASIPSIGECNQHNQQRTQSVSIASSSSSGSSSLSAAILDSIPAEEWNLPKLLMVGTVSGTLDDVMYGLATPDPGLMLLKAHYAQDEVIDGQVLAQIQGPTPSEPYRFLGLKWLVKGNPAAVSALVMPRDLVLLETTGVLSHPKSSERIGYFLMHSVSLPGCPDLPKKAAVRARISSCYIFKELGNGVVDVYMKGFVEASGKIADAVAIVSAANGLLCCWKAVVCAQSKKLVWAIKTKLRESKRRLALIEQSRLRDQRDDAASFCGMCSKTFKRFHRVACCQICDGAMCSRCRVTMKLGFPRVGEKEIRLKNVTLCKGCISRSNQQSTFEVAQREVLSGRFGSQYTTAASSSSASVAGTQQSTDSSVSSLSSGNRGNVATNKRSTVGSTSSCVSQRSYNNPGEILQAQAQEYASSGVPGTGGTILLAYAQDRVVITNKSTRGKTVSGDACCPQSSSVDSVADTAKSSMASEFNSNYSAYFSEGTGYESFDDLPPRPSEDDDMFGASTDVESVVTSDWGAVSPTSRQQYLDTVQGRTPEEQAMWKRMAQLHLQAENLYQFTKRNTAIISSGGVEAGGVYMAPPVSHSLSPRMSID